MKLDALISTVNKDVQNAVQSERFLIRAERKEDVAELLIFDGIGDDGWGGGITPTQVAEFLSENKDVPVLARINSPGGLAFDGLTIHNALQQHEAGVTTRIEGIAASAAAIIAAAGDTVEIYDNASIFVHNALALAVGNKRVMRDLADFLDKLDGQIAKTFARKTGKQARVVAKWMDGEVDGTVFNAEEAKENGLADKIVASRKPKNEDEAVRTARNEWLAKNRAARLQLLEMDAHQWQPATSANS